MYFYPRAHCTFEHLYGCKLLLTPTNNRLSRQGIGEPYLNPMLFQQLHAGFVHSIADQHFSYIEGHIWVGNEYTEKSGQPVDCVNFCQLLSATHDLRRRANKLNWLRERVSRAIEPDFECLSPVQCDCCFFWVITKPLRGSESATWILKFSPSSRAICSSWVCVCELFSIFARKTTILTHGRPCD